MLSYVLFLSTVKRLLAPMAIFFAILLQKCIRRLCTSGITLEAVGDWRILYKRPQYLQHSLAALVRTRSFYTLKTLYLIKVQFLPHREFAFLGLILECCVLKKIIVGCEYTITSGYRKFGF
jgi:hypothetical protein